MNSITNWIKSHKIASGGCGCLVVILILAIAIGGWMKASYNEMVKLDESVSTAWSNVQSQYQRRADLIPNLVNTVKGYAAHEKETLEGVIAARSKATQMTIDPSNLTEENMKKFQQAQGELSNALGKLLMVQERYPELKANENFSELQAQLEGTENRIAVERNNFNKVVEAYNLKVRSFPNNILAGMFGFEKKSKFEAEAGSEKAPEVKF